MTTPRMRAPFRPPGRRPSSEDAFSIKNLARGCLTASFLMVMICTVLKSSGASSQWLGALLCLSAGLAAAFLILGGAEIACSVGRHLRRPVLTRR